VKCNHDSGGATVIGEKHKWSAAERKITRHLARTYGVKNGEWGYWKIRPLCFVEEFFSGGHVDYKFHCVDGKVSFIQIVHGRFTDPYETIVDMHGRVLPLHINYRNRWVKDPPDLPRTWDQMAAIAKKLAKEFRYVRVDLYTYCDDIAFGELTFWPLAGCIRTGSDADLGAYLDFDTKKKREPIIL
jgi:hypothetical protein